MTAVVLICVFFGLWLWNEHRAAERRRTQPERRARHMRDLDHQVILSLPDAEQILRRMLVDDLRQAAARRHAVEQLQAAGLDVQWSVKEQRERWEAEMSLRNMLWPRRRT